MGKVLSVCVPSYNMEKYLNRCIDSFLVPEILDRLELIIVNDGSTDKTLSIANDYKTRYPQTIVVIDKPNGHYGSCVNASLKVATGKYFRIVDADDWVDSTTLGTIMGTLETIDVDCVCTKRTVHNMNEGTIVTDRFDDVPKDCIDLRMNYFPVQFLRMHNLMYSLSLLKRINYTQSEGICYTDTEYVYTPLSCARNVSFIDKTLYQYYVGRDDQSMSPHQLKKNTTHLVRIIQSIQKKHQSNSNFNKNEEIIWSTLIARLLYLVVPVYLLYSKKEDDIDSTLRSAIDSVLKYKDSCLSGVFENRFLGIPYVVYWYRKSALLNCLLPVLRIICRIRGY